MDRIEGVVTLYPVVSAWIFLPVTGSKDSVSGDDLPDTPKKRTNISVLAIKVSDIVLLIGDGNRELEVSRLADIFRVAGRLRISYQNKKTVIENNFFETILENRKGNHMIVRVVYT